MGEVAAGTLLAGRYQLRARITSVGGSGQQVWRSTDLARARPVAVWLPTPDYAAHAGEFLAAAHDAARISHPGIARILDFGQLDDEGVPFLVTELAAGTSIEVVMRAGLDPLWVLDVICQVSSALDVAHTAGLLHLDIQPGNLLFAPGGAVKVAGFWTPHALGPLRRPSRYSAPELAEGATATPASDLYSLGLVAWECLTSAPPCWPLSALPGTVPAPVAELITDLIAPDPRARPAAAAETAARSRELFTHPMRAGNRDVPRLLDPPPRGPMELARSA